MINANEYFDGNVKSLGFTDAESKATVGVMNPGSYEFSTSQKEIMQVISGVLKIQLPESGEWNTYSAGESFEVEANKTFQVEVTEPSSYLCRYYWFINLKPALALL